MANQLYPILPRVVDNNINAAPGAKLTFYVSGTTTPVTTYTTEACDVPHASPLVAASDGSLPAIWLASGAAKVVVTDADGATLFTIDPVVATAGAGLTAADIPFSPTVALPYDDVQSAVEGAAASAASGYASFGLGITGNATLLANIDATNIGAGAYRFDATTTGTFPSGISASDNGIIEHWRQASGSAMQMLYHATTDRIFHRRMASSSWGTWRENLTVNQGAVEGDIIYRGASAWSRLAKGTAGQFLRQNSGLTAPEWALSGARVLLATKTASASATLDFTEFNNATYKWYEFELEDVLPATDGVLLRMRFSTNAGVSYDAGASDYSYGNVTMEDDATPQNDNSGGTTFISLMNGYGAGLGAAAGELGVRGTLKLYGAGSAASKTSVNGLLMAEDTFGRMSSEWVSGRRMAAQDTDAVRFYMSAGNITSGTIRMYGVPA